MVEVSFENVALMIWAGLATAAWLHARDDARMAKKMLMLFIENKEAREDLLRAHAEFMRRKEG